MDSDFLLKHKELAYCWYTSSFEDYSIMSDAFSFPRDTGDLLPHQLLKEV